MNRQIDISELSGLVTFDESQLINFIELLDMQLPEEFKAPSGTLSIAILDDAHLAKIHDQFLSDPSETDVVTFEGDPDDDFAGEICASCQRAYKWAHNFQTTPSRELCLYIAHGYLHLAGVDDIAEDDALIMRKAEKLALEILDKNFKTEIFKFND